MQEREIILKSFRSRLVTLLQRFPQPTQPYTFNVTSATSSTTTPSTKISDSNSHTRQSATSETLKGADRRSGQRGSSCTDFSRESRHPPRCRPARPPELPKGRAPLKRPLLISRTEATTPLNVNPSFDALQASSESQSRVSRSASRLALPTAIRKMGLLRWCTDTEPTQRNTASPFTKNLIQFPEKCCAAPDQARHELRIDSTADSAESTTLDSIDSNPFSPSRRSTAATTAVPDGKIRAQSFNELFPAKTMASACSLTTDPRMRSLYDCSCSGCSLCYRMDGDMASVETVCRSSSYHEEDFLDSSVESYCHHPSESVRRSNFHAHSRASRNSLNSAPVKFGPQGSNCSIPKCLGERHGTMPCDIITHYGSFVDEGVPCLQRHRPASTSCDDSELVTDEEDDVEEEDEHHHPSGAPRRVQFGGADEKRRSAGSEYDDLAYKYELEMHHRLGTGTSDSLLLNGVYANRPWEEGRKGSSLLFITDEGALNQTAAAVSLSPWNTGMLKPGGDDGVTSFCRFGDECQHLVTPRKKKVATTATILENPVSVMKANEWARETAHIIGTDEGDEICYMLMRMNEEKICRRSHFQRQSVASGSGPDPLVQQYSGVNTRLCGPSRHSRRLRSAALWCGKAKTTVGLEVLRMKPHGIAILGEHAWSAMIAGIRIWAFLGLTSITKIDQHLFYLELTTGHFKLAKLGSSRPGNGSFVWKKSQSGTIDPVDPRASRDRRLRRVTNREDRRLNVMNGLRSGKYFPLENLVEIDRGRLIQSVVLSDPFLSKTEIGRSLKSVAALWSSNAVDPLICASETADDIDLLISVIKFLQFYNGIPPAEIVQKGGGGYAGSSERRSPSTSRLTSHISSTPTSARSPAITSGLLQPARLSNGFSRPVFLVSDEKQED